MEVHSRGLSDEGREDWTGSREGPKVTGPHEEVDLEPERVES